MRLRQRVEGLEAKETGGFKPWHRIMQYQDQTEEQAIAVYEAEHGQIGDNDSFIVRIITPGRTPDAQSAR